MVGARSTSAVEGLFAGLYDELCGVAARCLRREAREHTLAPPGVVHEAFLRLNEDPASLSDAERTRFLAVAAHTMRQVLVDHARRRTTEKRGGRWGRITLSDDVAVTGGSSVDFVALDEALTALAVEHERAARIVEMRFFGGMQETEVARGLGVSRTTVQGDWRFARAWLHRELDR